MIGTVKGQTPVRLYFDKSSGLLVRMVHYTDTALGLLPIQVDYDDYREVNGVKTPYRWTLGRPSGSFTIQIDKIEQNVAIEGSRFTEPKPAAASSTPASPPSTSAPPAHPQGPRPPQGSVPPSGATPAPGM